MSRPDAFPMGATFRVLPWGQYAHRLGRVVDVLPEHIIARVVLAFADGRRGAFVPSELAEPVAPELRPVWGTDHRGPHWRIQEIGPGGSGPYLRGPDGRFRTFPTAAVALAWIAELPAGPCQACGAPSDGAGILAPDAPGGTLLVNGAAVSIPATSGRPARFCAACMEALDDAGAFDGAPVFDDDLATVDDRGDR